MPEHLRAMMVVLILATVIFAFAKAPACAVASTAADFARRRNLWIGLSLILFLSYNFWVYIVVSGALLLFVQAREPNKLAMYFFVLLAVPTLPVKVPGLGVFNYLFDMHYIRLLALVVLLPAFLRLRKQPGVEPFGRLVPDKLIAGYMILTTALMVEHVPFTVTLRQGFFNPFVDIFLPYYVASRSLKTVADFRDALMAFVVAALVLSVTLIFEYARDWLLYQRVELLLGERGSVARYMFRGSSLRAVGTTGYSIAAGYVVAVAMGLFLYLRTLAPTPLVRNLAWLTLTMGLVAPVSRGPWVGAVAMLLLFIATGPAPVRTFTKLGVMGVIVFPLLLVSPVGERIIDHLPWIGKVDTVSIAARERIVEVSVQAMLQYPIFGRFDFIDNPAIQALRGTDGLIDLFSSYMTVGLSSGLVGLSLFAGTLLTAAFGIYKSMRSLTNINDERYVLGRALNATYIGILIIIGTVSFFDVVQATLWAVTGVGVAYARMLAHGNASESAESGNSRLATVKATT